MILACKGRRSPCTLEFAYFNENPVTVFTSFERMNPYESAHIVRHERPAQVKVHASLGDSTQAGYRVFEEEFIYLVLDS